LRKISLDNIRCLDFRSTTSSTKAKWLLCLKICYISSLVIRDKEVLWRHSKAWLKLYGCLYLSTAKYHSIASLVSLRSYIVSMTSPSKLYQAELNSVIRMNKGSSMYSLSKKQITFAKFSSLSSAIRKLKRPFVTNRK
jgi:hypothetical protein